MKSSLVRGSLARESVHHVADEAPERLVLDVGHLGPQLHGSAGPSRIQQTVQALLFEPLLPVPLAAGALGPNGRNRKARGQKKQDLCPAHPACGHVSGPHNAFKVLSLLGERNLEKSPQPRQMELQSFSRGRYAP